jgi:hypothetical protein
MQHGPFGITSRANIFMATYSAISFLTLELDALKHSRNLSTETVIAIQGKNDKLVILLD